MKKFILCFLLLLMLVAPAWAVKEVGYYEIRNSLGIEAETAAYLGINPTATTAQIVSVNDNIRAIKYLTGATLTSQTMNLSTVAGAAFISNPLTDLRPYLGFKATITAGGKTLVGWIKAGGAGETLGSELLTSVSQHPSSPYDTLTVSGKNITSGINNTSSDEYAVSNSGNVSLGALYKITTTMTLNSGTAPVVSLFYSAGSSDTTYNLTTENRYLTSRKADALDYFYVLNNYGTLVNFALTPSIKKILTPSATGVTIVSVQGGTTYNWASNDGIDPNAASFTVVITKN
jgi:hypothetical protein